MAQTYGDFIRECDLYQYSKEAFELNKACSELKLMGQFIESQLFLAENAEFLEENRERFTEGFFAESVTSDDVMEILEAGEQKSRGVFGTIGHGIKSLFGKIGSFLSKLFGSNQNSKEEAERNDAAFVTYVNGLSADDLKGTLASLTTLMDGAWKKEYMNAGFFIHKDQPDKASVRGVNYFRGAKDDRIQSYYIAGLAPYSVRLEVKDSINACEHTALLTALTQARDLSDGKLTYNTAKGTDKWSSREAGISSVKKRLERAIADTKSKGLRVPIMSEKEFKRFDDQMKQIRGNLKTIGVGESVEAAEPITEAKGNANRDFVDNILSNKYAVTADNITNVQKKLAAYVASPAPDDAATAAAKKKQVDGIISKVQKNDKAHAASTSTLAGVNAAQFADTEQRKNALKDSNLLNDLYQLIMQAMTGMMRAYTYVYNYRATVNKELKSKYGDVEREEKHRAAEERRANRNGTVNETW